MPRVCKTSRSTVLIFFNTTHTFSIGSGCVIVDSLSASLKEQNAHNIGHKFSCYSYDITDKTKHLHMINT